MAASMKTTSAVKAVLKWSAQVRLPEGLRLHVEPGFEVPLDGTTEALERQEAETRTKSGHARQVLCYPIRITLTHRSTDVGDWYPTGRRVVMAAQDGGIRGRGGAASKAGVGLAAVPLDETHRGQKWNRVETADALREWLDTWLAEEVSSL